MTLISSISQQLSPLLQSWQNAETTTTTTTTASTSETQSSPAIIIDISESEDSGSTEDLTKAETEAIEDALKAQEEAAEAAEDAANEAEENGTTAPVSEASAQSAMQVTAGEGAGSKEAPTSAAQRSAGIEGQASVEFDRAEEVQEADDIDASRAAAQQLRDSLLRDEFVSSVGSAPKVESLIKPVEADAPERANNVYSAAANKTSEPPAKEKLNVSV